MPRRNNPSEGCIVSFEGSYMKDQVQEAGATRLSGIAEPNGTPQKKKSGMKHLRKKESIFLFFFLLFPIVQFLIFYVGVNFNSFLLAFQKTENGVQTFAGFENFGLVLRDIFVTKQLGKAILNSFIQFLISLFVALPLQVIVAYAVFKKIPGSGFFKIMLFMPSMISSVVFVICVRVLVTDGFPILFRFKGRSRILQARKYVVFAGTLARRDPFDLPHDHHLRHYIVYGVFRGIRTFLFLLRRRAGRNALRHVRLGILLKGGALAGDAERYELCGGGRYFVHHDYRARYHIGKISVGKIRTERGLSR